MESFGRSEDARARDEAPPGSAAAAEDKSEGSDGRAVAKPSRQRRSTRGGAGSVAGATPKKAHRPPTSSRPRPAGKKPDSGPR